MTDSSGNTEAPKKDFTIYTNERGETFKTTERVIKEVPPPNTNIPSDEEFWSKEDPTKPNLALLKDHFIHEGRIKEEHALAIIEKATEIFKQEETLLEVDAPITVCGDIHGQYYDLMKLFEIGGKPSETRYLFLGDYVDRGCFGTEVCILLFALKINSPNTIHLLRGNHECRLMTSHFTFKQECLWKYTPHIYKLFMKTFDCLPLCAVIQTNMGNFFCVHGGISPSLRKLNDIKEIDRFQEPPDDGLFCDLLWSDPMNDSKYSSYSKDDKIRFHSIIWTKFYKRM